MQLTNKFNSIYKNCRIVKMPKKNLLPEKKETIINKLPQRILSTRSSARPPNKVDSFENHFESANLFVKNFEEIQIRQLKCFREECHEKVACECKCLAKTFFMCQNDVGTHISQYPLKTHMPTVLNSDICDQKCQKVVNYLDEYNSQLKNLKKKMVSEVTKHVEKINKDFSLICTKINAAISKNKKKIRDLKSSNLKILENITQLQMNSLKEFTKKCDKIEVSDQCSDILQAVINDWNATKIDRSISKTSAISYKPRRQMLEIKKSYESVEITELKQRISHNETKSILH